MHGEREKARLKKSPNEELEEHYRSYVSEAPPTHTKVEHLSFALDTIKKLTKKRSSSSNEKKKEVISALAKHINTYVLIVLEAERSRAEKTSQYAAMALPEIYSVVPRVKEFSLDNGEWSLFFKSWQNKIIDTPPFTLGTPKLEKLGIPTAPNTTQIIFKGVVKVNDIELAYVPI